MDISGIIHELTVVAVKEEVAGVRTITVAATDGHVFAYAPGQFITLVFQQFGREERRSYSISSLPQDNRLSFTVKRIDNGAYSRMLTDTLRVGDKLYTSGVGGMFVLPPDTGRYKQVFFFAAGIGITPVLPMITSCLLQHHNTDIVLIYSNTHAQTTAFSNELNTLQQKHPARLRIEYLMSTAFMLQRARLSKELIPTLLREYGTAAAEESLYYTCGPHAYMRMIMYTLRAMGVHDAHIKRELFTPMPAIPVVTPADTGTYTATLLLGDRKYEFSVAYPDSILAAAKKQGLTLPYSCEAGRCGSCVARCIAGRVWHSYNEVLTDNELAAGSVLTCTAHPNGGDVTLAV